MIKKPSLISLKEASGMLKVSTQTLRRWDKSQKLKPVRIIGRGDRKYKLQDIQKLIETESSKPESSYGKGKKMEDHLEELMRLALGEWGFTIKKLRTQSSGHQFGKDNISRWVGKINGKSVDFDWVLEAKSHGSPSRKVTISSTELENKLTKIQNTRAPQPDCWCVFAPYGTPENEFLDLAEGANSNGTYKFKIVFWTIDDQIKDLISCFPDLYFKIYGEKPNLSLEKRKIILDHWKSQVIDITQEAKIIKADSPTSITRNTTSETPAGKKEKAKIETEAIEASVYRSQQPQDPSSISKLESQKAGINDEIDKALLHLNKNNPDEAKPMLFHILGKIEGKDGLEHELARTYNNLGVAFNIEGDVDKSIEYFQKAIDLEDRFTIGIANLANAYITKSEEVQPNESSKYLDKAEAIITPLWKSDTKNPHPSTLRGYLRLIKAKHGLNKLIESIEDLEKKNNSNIFKTSGTLAFIAGNYYLEARQPKKALEYAVLACKLDKDIETLVFRGRALLGVAMEEDLGKANNVFDDIAPKFKDSHKIDQAVKDFDEAMELAIEEKDKNSYPQIYYFQQLSKIWSGRTPESIEDKLKGREADFVKSVKAFRERSFETSFNLLKSLPEFKEMDYAEIFRLARVYLYNGSPEIARLLFQIIEEESVKRKNIHFWMDLSVVAVLLGDKNKAIMAATTAKDLADNPEDKRIAFSHFGAVTMRYANQEGGDRLLENALEFDKEFPGLKVIEKYDFEKDQNKLIQIFKDQRAWADNIIKIFRDNPIPSYFLQKTFKKPYISVWATRGPEMPIEFTITSAEFHKELQENFSNGKVVVFDYISLLTLSKLELLSDLAKIFPKMQIPFSLFLKIQDELMQEENENLRRLWDFLRKSNSIEIVKEIPKRKLKGEKMNEVFESWIVDCIKLAKEKNRTMVTDDFRFFRFLKSESIRPINSWVVLENAKKMKIIDARMYSKAKGKLGECFYTFISFDGDDLYYIAEEDHFELKARTYHLINQIFLPGSNYKSFSTVFIKFIMNLWKSGATSEHKIFWIDYLSNIFGTLSEDLTHKPLHEQSSILDTAPDFGSMWSIAIKSGSKDDTLALKDKMPELLNQKVFSKAKLTIIKELEQRLKELDNG